jgi:hypothetical protein
LRQSRHKPDSKRAERQLFSTLKIMPFHITERLAISDLVENILKPFIFLPMYLFELDMP